MERKLENQRRVTHKRTFQLPGGVEKTEEIIEVYTVSSIINNNYKNTVTADFDAAQQHQTFIEQQNALQQLPTSSLWYHALNAPSLEEAQKRFKQMVQHHRIIPQVYDDDPRVMAQQLSDHYQRLTNHRELRRGVFQLYTKLVTYLAGRLHARNHEYRRLQQVLQKFQRDYQEDLPNLEDRTLVRFYRKYPKIGTELASVFSLYRDQKKLKMKQDKQRHHNAKNNATLRLILGLTHEEAHRLLQSGPKYYKYKDILNVKPVYQEISKGFKAHLRRLRTLWYIKHPEDFQMSTQDVKQLKLLPYSSVGDHVIGESPLQWFVKIPPENQWVLRLSKHCEIPLSCSQRLLPNYNFRPLLQHHVNRELQPRPLEPMVTIEHENGKTQKVPRRLIFQPTQ